MKYLMEPATFDQLQSQITVCLEYSILALGRARADPPARSQRPVPSRLRQGRMHSRLLWMQLSCVCVL